jgi:hypothetical protein
VLNVLRRLVGLLLIGLVLPATPALATPPPPPVVSAPAAVTAEPDDRTGAKVAFQVSATDWKGRAVPVTCEPPSASLFPLGTSPVSCSAVDRRERSTTVSFPVTVEHLYRPRERAPVVSFRKLRFAWYPAAAARLYNLQLWRKSQDGWKKIASVFPTQAVFVLPRRWAHEGHRYRLVKGIYRWYAWPWFGSRYGPVLGQNTFVASGRG